MRETAFTAPESGVHVTLTVCTRNDDEVKEKSQEEEQAGKLRGEDEPDQKEIEAKEVLENICVTTLNDEELNGMADEVVRRFQEGTEAEELRAYSCPTGQ